MSSEGEVVVTMRSGPAAAMLTVILLSACGAGGEDSSETVGSLDQIASVETEVVASEASSSEPSVSASPLVVIDYAGGATYVTGRIADFRIDQGTLSTDADGSQHSRDGTINYQVLSDDPRVNGTVTGTWNSDRWGTDITNTVLTQWGVATLRNDDGSWEAPYEGAFASPYGDILTRWWRGTGEYEGLTFFMWVAGSEVGSPDYEWAGIIFPGDPPPTVAND